MTQEDPEAMQRATQSADDIFASLGLDQDLDDPEVAEMYASVQNWFARYDDEIEAMERGEDDGCPCEECRAHFDGAPEHPEA